MPITTEVEFQADPEAIKEMAGLVGVKDDYFQTMASGTAGLLTSVLQAQPDMLFFLDKSARPSAHIFRHVWGRRLAHIPRPRIRHMNMPKELAFGKVSSDAIKVIRKTYKGVRKGTKIMVVDEMKATGTTIQSASEMLEQAFPQAVVLPPVTHLPYVPDWYRSKHKLGVEEIDYENEGMLVRRRFTHRNYFLAHRRELNRLVALISPHLYLRVRSY